MENRWFAFRGAFVLLGALVAFPRQPQAGTPPPTADCHRRAGILCFAAPSEFMEFAKVGPYCKAKGMRAPGFAEYAYAFPHDPPRADGNYLWTADAQRNSESAEYGVTVIYRNGRWEFDSMEGTGVAPVTCVDRLLPKDGAGEVEGTRHYLGMAPEKAKAIAVGQERNYWCWAAVAQMIRRVEGYADIPQDELVPKMLGRLADEPLPPELMISGFAKADIVLLDAKEVKDRWAYTWKGADGAIEPVVGYNPKKDVIGKAQLAADMLEGEVYILPYDAGANAGHVVLLVGVEVVITPDVAVVDEGVLETGNVSIVAYHVINPWKNAGLQVIVPNATAELPWYKVEQQGTH